MPCCGFYIADGGLQLYLAARCNLILQRAIITTTKAVTHALAIAHLAFQEQWGELAVKAMITSGV